MIEKLYQIYLKHPKVCTDTRKVEKGAIFFALKGENFNGNKFAGEALDNGCAYAVVDEKEYAAEHNEQYILVENTLTTLQELAQFHRSKLDIPFLGITGSNGKTTTKELINTVLSKKYKTHATVGNLNNHIGVPLTLLDIPKDAGFAIIEMGANHVGEIAELCRIAQPDYGLITNIGKAHLEGFGSIEGVIKAKKELYDYIKANGIKIFINTDNEILTNISHDIEKFTYGSHQHPYCSGELVEASPHVIVKWKTRKDETFKANINSKLIGGYNFENILAAICVGHYFGVKDEDIKNAIESYIPSNNRSQLIKKGNHTIFLDAYNANPVSMTAATENFSKIKANNKVVIFGDMLELGNESEKEHQHLVDLLEKRGFEHVLLVGKEFSKTKTPSSFKKFKNSEEVSAYLKEKNYASASFLIKGSRRIGLEKLAEAI